MVAAAVAVKDKGERPKRRSVANRPEWQRVAGLVMNETPSNESDNPPQEDPPRPPPNKDWVETEGGMYKRDPPEEHRQDYPREKS